MKILVLNIDRDDDFGRKAKISSPIIGLKQNLEAANRLGQADPEDSDLNAIYSAISTYNTLVNQKKDVEIATICGHMDVGVKSDEIITQQLEQVLKETNTDNVILVTDGAEDEYVLPIIQSRIKITSIHRVTVKQSRELEDTYFRLLKIFEDEKVQKHFVLPIALVLIVGAFFVLIGMVASGFGAILMTLGFYLLIRVFRWERQLSKMLDEVKDGFIAGKLSMFTSIIALAIIIASVFISYFDVTRETYYSDVPILPILFFLTRMIWGIVLAGIVVLTGRVVDTYLVDKRSPWKYWPAPFSVFAFGFISFAICSALYQSLRRWPDRFDLDQFFTLSFIVYVSLGVGIVIFGAITNNYIKEIHKEQKNELEIEEQITKTL